GRRQQRLRQADRRARRDRHPRPGHERERAFRLWRVRRDGEPPVFGLGGAAEKASLPFSVEAGRGTTVTLSLSAPRSVGLYAFKVTAASGDLSDGELRPVPVLPGRMHLLQSRFVTLHDRDRREMAFPDLARNDDASLV